MARRSVLLIAAVLIAAVGTAMILLYVKGIDDRATRGQELVEVLTATETIEAGETVAAAQDPRLGPTFTTFSASTPQLYLDLDRERLQTLGVSVSDLFAALQGTLGSVYVNDFNLYGRTWQVRMQAREADRAAVADIQRIHVRSATDEMVPIGAVARVELSAPATHANGAGKPVEPQFFEVELSAQKLSELNLAAGQPVRLVSSRLRVFEQGAQT